jgi:hypothetical protein
MTLILPRRKFLTGVAALFCAPAIVRASSLMKIKPLYDGLRLSDWRYAVYSFDAAAFRLAFMRQEPMLTSEPLAFRGIPIVLSSESGHPASVSDIPALTGSAAP